MSLEGGFGFANPPMIIGAFWITAFAGMTEEAGRVFVSRASLGVEPLVPSAPGQQVVRANRKEGNGPRRLVEPRRRVEPGCRVALRFLVKTI